MKQNYEDFDEFIDWLKRDGLKPKQSERIWRKKIFANLQNGHKKSLENYQDFLLNKKIQSLQSQRVQYKHIDSRILLVEQMHRFLKLTLEDGGILKIPDKELNNFMENCVIGEENA